MIITPFYTFTRPADTTAYAALDLVANSTTAASVVPLSWSMKRLGGSGFLRGVKFYKSNPTVTAAIFNLHLYSATPGTPTNGDNGAYAIASAANNIGLVTVDMTTGSSVGTVGAFKRVGSLDIGIDFSNVLSTVYGLLTTGTSGTYTPTSGETFTITLELDSNR